MKPAFVIRYKTFTSFAIFLLAMVSLGRLLAVAPLSARTAPAIVVVLIIAAAALWRGLLFARSARVSAGS